MNYLLQAIERAGGQKALGDALGVKQGQVWCWANRDGKTPERYCPAIEQRFGVRCEQLRPDITWTRGVDGQITGYHVPLSLPASKDQQQPLDTGVLSP